MDPVSQVDSLAPLVELLVEAADTNVREHILLEAALATGAARAACLWRSITPSPGHRAGGWSPVLARGDAELLPTPAEVRAVLEGALPPELPGGRQILLDGQDPPVRVLALGGVGAEDAVDVLEALLTTAALVGDAAARTPSDLLASLSAPLPSENARRATSRKLRHDLRNLLTSIRATQDLLQHYASDLDGEEVTRFRGVLEQGYRSAADLLAGALRGDAAAGQAERREAGRCRPTAVARDTAAIEVAPLLLAGIELDVWVEDGLDEVTSPISAAELGRVLQNLLVNARQSLSLHPVEAPTVAVTVRRVPVTQRLRIEVRDNGAGIPPEDLERVFEEGFTRGKSTGTGIGLATVRELVLAAGGAVRACSGPAGGAWLTIELPIEDAF